MARAQTALETFARRQCYGLNKECDPRGKGDDDGRYCDQHCCSLLLGEDILLVLATCHLVQVVHRASVFTDSPYVFVSDANAFGQSTVCVPFESLKHCVCMCVVGVFGIIAEIIISHPRTNRAEVQWAS